MGFTWTARRTKRTGVCGEHRCRDAGHFEIFIRPARAASPDMMLMQIAAIHGHELVHAAVGISAGHGPKFRRVAKGVGLVGSMRAMTAGLEFEAASFAGRN